MDNFSVSLQPFKRVVRARGGIVAAQHRRAAELGAAVLDAGGEAVDAAIATSFALGVLEPWMSGIGGGGAMVLYRARENSYRVIDFGMRAPASLDPADYPLTGEGMAADLFLWPRVRDDRNMRGPFAIAVPGVVDGMRLACERYARLPWRELVRPAVTLAEEGLLIDWFATLNIASAAADLKLDEGARAAYLPQGLPPVAPWSARSTVRLPQTALAATLHRLAEAGPRDFYDGALAERVTQAITVLGGRLSSADLANYRAREVDPLFITHREARIAVTPELTGGPTLADTLRRLRALLPVPAGTAPDAQAYTAMAQSLQAAYAARLTQMGDVDGGRAPACTTHFSVVDAEGNMVAVTQTLLSLFGARVQLPDTGILMNNGIMWFDTEAGRPNSLAPGKRCLTNYCPVIGEQGARRFALGASGGRRILPAVAQLLCFLIDSGDTLESAFHRARIDASEGDLVIGDSALDAAVHAALGARFDYVTQHRLTWPFKFACPSGVLRDGAVNEGITEIGNPWGDAVAQPHSP